MDEKNGLPILFFASQGDWETWLGEHHRTSKGLWLKMAKKASGIDSVNYAEALDVALCHGWIDGQKGAFDDTYWIQRSRRAACGASGPKSTSTRRRR